MQPTRILIIGANGQLGTELVTALADSFGADQIIATDLREPAAPHGVAFRQLDVTQGDKLQQLVEKEHITQIYHLAAILSATGEKDPHWAWQINMNGLFNVLETAKNLRLDRVYWPSSIAVFGNNTPKEQTPQETVAEPSTVYGISKHAGELWCQYYFQKYGLDVRSLRYPGLIGYKSLPGGGTTDYAVDIFHKAVKNEPFTCFLKADTPLPMLYMPDAVRATLELMNAPAERISVRTSYNLQGMTFTPAQIAEAIRKHVPQFEVDYAPDFRQQIAESWPASLDDTPARQDWGWQPHYLLPDMTADMLHHLS